MPPMLVIFLTFTAGNNHLIYMAKKKDNNNLPDNLEMIKKKAFEEGLKKFDSEQLNFLKEFGINNFDDLMGALALTGINMDKFIDSVQNDEEFPETEEEFVKRFFDQDFQDDDWDDEDDDWDDDDEDDDFDDFDDDEKNITCVLHDTQPQEFHLRVKLNNAPVPIWREVKVPSCLSLAAFGHLLQDIMGWQHEHLYQFIQKDVRYVSPKDLHFSQNSLFPQQFIEHDANKFHLGNVFQTKGDRIVFEYDFGDSWYHDIWLKGVRNYEEGEQPKAHLLKGKGACPPEDCGGVWGYAYLLELASKKRKNADERERLEWYGIDKHFDPNYFDLEEEQYYIEETWEYLEGIDKNLKQKK